MHSSGEFRIIHAKFPTCHRSTTGSFIDHFMITSDLDEVVSNRAENIVKSSDHTGIAIETTINFVQQDNANVNRKLFDRANFDAINEDVSRRLDTLLIPTTSNLQQDDIESIVTALHEIFRAVIDEHVPSSSSHASIRISKQSTILLKEKRRLRRLLNRRLNNQRSTPQEIAAIHSSINHGSC